MNKVARAASFGASLAVLSFATAGFAQSVDPAAAAATPRSDAAVAPIAGPAPQPIEAQPVGPQAVEAPSGEAQSGQPTIADAASPLSAADIVVTGSRLTSGFAAPTPVTVLGSLQLQQRAPSAVAETLYELPAFNNNGPSQANRGSTSVGANVLDLRGIGGVRTLVLVDGRRYTPSNTTTVFDTNLIPTGLVERAEVVTGGASAAYGSDAVTGVVNFILKDKIQGIQATAQYGFSQRGDNRELTVNLAAGTKLGENVHVTVAADYSDNKGVGFPGVGFYARDWGQNEYGRLSLPASRAAGLPANIIAANVEFANKTPGGLIPSGPLRGTAFDQNGQPYQFQFGTIVGTDQMIGSTANFGFTVTGKQPLRTPNRRFVTLGRIAAQITEDVELLLEGNYAKQNGNANTAQPQVDGIIISSANPYLPTATRDAMTRAGLSTITLGRLFEETGPFRTHNTNRLIQGTASLRGSLSDFKWDAYYSHGENKYHLDVRNVLDVPNLRAAYNAVLDPATGQIVCGPVATNPNLNALQRTQVEPGCVPFNVIGTGRASQAAIQYVTNYMSQDVTATQDVAAANISGEPINLWAGPVAVAAGIEWRRNKAVGDSDARSKINANFYGNYKPIEGRITVKEGYLEVGLPLAKDTSFAKTLDLNGAVRVTDYSTSGTVVTWKAGVTYEPFDLLRVRVTRSRDIRAPNISELFAQGVGGVFTGSNPRTGAGGIAQTTTRGNPDLKPEIARTWTGGIVLTPTAFIPRLRASVDYFNIEISDVIATPVATDVVNGCFSDNDADFCSRIVLDNTAVLGFSQVFLDPLNLNSFKAEGVDFELAYGVPIESLGVPGRLDVRALGTYLSRLETFNVKGVSLGNQAGGGGVPIAGISGLSKWRWTVNANYALGGFNANLQLRTLSPIKYNAQLVGPEDAGYDPARPNSINKNRYPAAAYLNLALSYDIISDGQRRLQIFGNVDNLLDKDPPFGWIQDIFTYDTTGRTFKVGARFAF